MLTILLVSFFSSSCLITSTCSPKLCDCVTVLLAFSLYQYVYLLATIFTLVSLTKMFKLLLVMLQRGVLNNAYLEREKIVVLLLWGEITNFLKLSEKSVGYKFYSVFSYFLIVLLQTVEECFVVITSFLHVICVMTMENHICTTFSEMSSSSCIPMIIITPHNEVVIYKL